MSAMSRPLCQRPADCHAKGPGHCRSCHTRGLPSQNAWTEERTAKLVALFEGGLTLREIGRHFGLSANAISGKVSRLGLTRPPITTARHDVPRDVRERENARRRAYKARNKLKVKAQSDVLWAIRSGRLTRQPCERCGATPAHAHHDDYLKPLDVRWLCVAHHMQHHRDHAAPQKEAA